MEYVLITVTSFFIAAVTLFSGFGLGTVLLPVFSLFFPIDLAIGMTAIVHFFNNIFKLSLLGKKASKEVTLKFGIPAILAAFIGAWILINFLNITPLTSYHFKGKEFYIEPLKLIIGILIAIFALFEIVPQLKKISIKQKYLPLGGLLSGFFGGLSGHQGALRSIFLLKCNLSKESFIATGIVLACLVDFARLLIYSARFRVVFQQGNLYLLLSAVMAAFLGVLMANRFLKKITMRIVQLIIAGMLFTISAGLCLGLV